MEFFKHDTKIDFMAQRRYAAIASVILFVLSIISLGVYGLNWGLDFTGGTQIQLHFPAPADISQVREQLQHAGFPRAVVYSYGNSQDVLVSVVPKSAAVGSSADATQAQEDLAAQVNQALPTAKVQQVDFIGPQVGHELATQGTLAIVIALLGTMIYIALRFEFRFAVGSTVALIHDPVIILGIFAFLQIEFNLITLAAVLTVIGYSLNDTIVIFDRVRENFRKLRKAAPFVVVNQATNETLSRTIMTSALTLTVCLALFFSRWQHVTRLCIGVDYWYCRWYVLINLCRWFPGVKFRFDSSTPVTAYEGGT